MELDQVIFGKISNWFLKIRSKPDEKELAKTVYLEDVQNELSIIARAITGLPIDIIEAENIGGWRDHQFLLPSNSSVFESSKMNLEFYHFRVVYLSILLEHFYQNDHSISQGNIIESSHINKLIINRMEQDYHPVFQFYLNFKSYLLEHEIDEKILYGKFYKPSLSKDEIKDLNNDFDAHALPKAKTEIKAKAVDEIKSLETKQEDGTEDYVLTHNFEKVDTAEEFKGNWRDFDGADELEEQSNALDQVKMDQTVRVNDQTHSVYQSDLIFDATVPESADVHDKIVKQFVYDEWDFKSKSYRKDYCTVYEEIWNKNNAQYAIKTIEENGIIIRNVRKQFAQFFNDLKQIRKLDQGEEIGMDEYIDFVTDITNGSQVNEKIYNSKRKRKRDISFLFLLDTSLSSDGYADGKRIIDIEKQIAIILGEIFEEYQINFQIDAFNSKTRNHCSYYPLKSFKENWRAAKSRIGTIVPAGYTRIGPALRHAKGILSKTDSKKKWLIILSDGKPNDYDKYEGKYGVADVRQALREIDQEGIKVHTFAIEEKAKFYLPLLFGAQNYNVLASPKELIEAISVFCRKVMQQ